MFVYLYLVKKEVMSKNKTNFLIYSLLLKYFHTFLTKFKNCECNIFGPIFCKSSRSVFNIGLLDSLNVVTVLERISQSF
jgi:hypothetical protein